MAGLENVKRFLTAAQDQASQIHPIYLRNFRDLIKIIPVVGSVIDANTLGLVEDSVLRERLTNLESACERALQLEDAELLLAEVLNINSIFFLLLITSQGQLLDQGRKVADELRVLSESGSGRPLRTPDNDFVFVTISGPSAVGKDRVLDKISTRRRSPTAGSKL